MLLLGRLLPNYHAIRARRLRHELHHQYIILIVCFAIALTTRHRKLASNLSVQSYFGYFRWLPQVILTAYYSFADSYSLTAAVILGIRGWRPSFVVH